MSLFHYTDAYAVMSILKNQQIWMTDIRFLNDSQEFHDGVGFVQDAIGKVGLEDERPHMRVALQYLGDLDLKMFDGELKNNPKFLCSFSQAGNLLSQWRSYGDYAVEFDKVSLSGYLSLFDCVYNEAQKEKIADEKVGQVFASFASGARAHAIPERGSVEAAQYELVSQCLIFKNSFFSEESEVRSTVTKEKSSPDIKYRVKGGVLIPYVPYEFPLHCIKAVHIGPMANQQLAKESMQMFIDQLLIGVRQKVPHDFKIDVICSVIPYRTL